MRREAKILLTVICGNLLLSFLFAYQRHQLYLENGSNIEDYLLLLLASFVLITILSFILGLITWFILKRFQFEKVFYFITFNIIGLVFLLFASSYQTYKVWHYNKYQANIDYNESLTKNGGYLDTCMIMVQEDIKSQGLSSNDYRIFTYSYEQALTTIPKDTTNKFYSFEVIYSKIYNDTKSVRAASYFIDFNGRIKRVYDVDTKDKKAKKQIEALKQDFIKLKKVLEQYPDSLNKQFLDIKTKLKALD